jgi:hypothetical protein
MFSCPLEEQIWEQAYSWCPGDTLPEDIFVADDTGAGIYFTGRHRHRA